MTLTLLMGPDYFMSLHLCLSDVSLWLDESYKIRERILQWGAFLMAYQ